MDRATPTSTQLRPSALPCVLALHAGGRSALEPDGGATGMRKAKLSGLVSVGFEGIPGDDIVDRRYHGGPERALCVYDVAYYGVLAAQFPKPDEPWQPGGFGENITTQDLPDTDVCIGDIYQAGSIVFQVSQPRSPCWKLNARFGLKKLSKFVQHSRISGWYARILEAGEIREGDALHLLERQKETCTLPVFWDTVLANPPDPERLAWVARIPTLSEEWRTKLAKQAQWLIEKRG